MIHLKYTAPLVTAFGGVVLALLTVTAGTSHSKVDCDAKRNPHTDQIVFKHH